MTFDDDFKPKLGKIRSIGSKRGSKYLHQVLRAVALAGGTKAPSKGGFQGSRSGRGAGVGRVLASRDQFAAFRQRRVVIKSRFVKIKAKGIKGAQLHLRYIQRDGVTREGSPGELYAAHEDRTDGKAFLKRCEPDRHQFRFIVAAEDADQYAELKPFIRNLMGQMEADLGTKLDWVAVDHFNTGHPHTHIMLRGTDDKGRDLVIAREYLSQGMRERAAELVSLDLGPRTDLEVENHIRREVDQERFTSIDRRLVKHMDAARIVGTPPYPETPFQQSVRAGRLQKLARLGLAQEIAPGRWRLAENLEGTLRDISMRGDIIKTLHRELSAKGLVRAPTDYAIYDPKSPETRPIIGRVVSRGLSDEFADRHYLVVDGSDGYSHYVDIGKGEVTEAISEGSVVELTPKKAEAREVDRTVADIAAAHGGRYSVDIHLRHDRTATATYAETHVRRLEAMRRLEGTVERQPDGTWVIAPGHVERAIAYERARNEAAPVAVRTLSRLALDSQTGALGETWLDQELVSRSPLPLRDAGFGRAARQALEQRRQWLVEQGFAEEKNGRAVVRANVLGRLRQRELARTGDLMSKELGLAYRDVGHARHVSGIYRKPVDLVSGRFAVIQTGGKEFALVPWKPVLDRNIGRQVSGIVRGESISWTLAKARDLGR